MWRAANAKLRAINQRSSSSGRKRSSSVPEAEQLVNGVSSEQKLMSELEQLTKQRDSLQVQVFRELV